MQLRKNFRLIGVTAAAIVGMACSASHGQIYFVELLYHSNYRQTATNAFTNLGSDLQAILLAQSANNLNDASVYYVDDDYDISLSTFGGGAYSGTFGSASSQGNLLLSFGAGDYEFSWSGGTLGSGTVTVNQPFSSGLWPSGSQPRFTATTFTTAQGMNPSQPFTFALINSFFPAPQSESESGGFYISTVQGSGLPGSVVYSQIGAEADALPNSRVLPANTLAPNTQYFVTWLFSNAIDDDPIEIGNSKVEFRTSTRMLFSTGAASPACDSIDFNNDSLFPDTADIDDFLSVFSGGPCSTGTCGDIDFNNDELFPDTTDIDSLLSVFSGGACI